LNSTLGVIRSKIVDMALQSGGVRVVANQDVEDDKCAETAGAQWLDLDGGHCFMLMQKTSGGSDCE